MKGLSECHPDRTPGAGLLRVGVKNGLGTRSQQPHKICVSETGRVSLCGSAFVLGVAVVSLSLSLGSDMNRFACVCVCACVCSHFGQLNVTGWIRSVSS